MTQRRPLEDLDLAWAGDGVSRAADGGLSDGTGRGGYLAFLGRISPEKRAGPGHRCAAKRAGIPLKIAAKVTHVDRSYFERKIEPLLTNPLIVFVGEIGEADKPGFLGEAMGLLFPIDWPEPFGLVMIEAMACGTPVVARPCGSVPEVITHGRTGSIADSLDEIVAAVRRLHRIDRTACRREAEARLQRGSDGGRLRSDLRKARGRAHSSPETQASTRKPPCSSRTTRKAHGDRYYIPAHPLPAATSRGWWMKRDDAFFVADHRGDFPGAARQRVRILRRRHPLPAEPRAARSTDSSPCS
jgi:hypothetical protein